MSAGTGATLDPLYHGQATSDRYGEVQQMMPFLMQPQQIQQMPPQGMGGQMQQQSSIDPDLLQSAMRYLMNIPLESQNYEYALDSEYGHKAVKPLQYETHAQRDFVEQHEEDKKAYESLTKSYKQNSQYQSNQGASLMTGGGTDVLSLYKTLLGGA